MKIVLTIIGWLAICFSLIFLLQGFGLINLKFWGVKYQDAHREIFEKTKSYNHGMIRDLENLCLQYQELESDSHKQAIAATIRHRKSSFNGELPQHVKNCINSL